MSNALPEKILEEKGLPYIGKRKLRKVGGSVVVSIPKEFIKTNNLDAEDEVFVFVDNDLLISTNPKHIEKAHEAIENVIQNKNPQKKLEKKEKKIYLDDMCNVPDR